MIAGFSFRSPLWLWALLFVPLLAVWRWRLLSTRRRAIAFPLAAQIEALFGRATWYPWVSPALALGAMAFLTFALARPVVATARTTVRSEGVATLLVLDISGSMLAEDFQPSNRIDMAKLVVSDFIKKRPDDRIGLLSFAAMPFLRCPLTLDHKTLLDIVAALKPVGRQDIDGTAIGDALVTAGKRLLTAPEKSRVIVLLTDGDNNRGQFDPIQAAELLGAHKIKVYAVGIGSKGLVPYPIYGEGGTKSYQMVHIGFGEETLRAIAKATDGVYYNATDARGLTQVFADIDRLEKTKVESQGYVRYRELFLWPLAMGVALLSMEALWRSGPGRTLP
jgi:Ca-activated chloride channel family protein